MWVLKGVQGYSKKKKKEKEKTHEKGQGGNCEGGGGGGYRIINGNGKNTIKKL